MQQDFENSEQRDSAHFLQKYEAQASLSSHKMYAVREPFNYSFSYDLRSVPYSFQVRQEPYVEMYIPQERYKQLIENEKIIRQLEDDRRYYKDIVDSHRADERVRESNPVVKKAWQKYSTLLALMRK
jgi:hypothetical protein